MMKDSNQPVEKNESSPAKKVTDINNTADPLVIGSLRTSELFRDDEDPIVEPRMDTLLEDAEGHPDMSADVEETFREGYYDVSNNLEIKVPTEPLEGPLNEPKPVVEQRIPKSPTKIVDSKNNLMRNDNDIPMKSVEADEIDDEGFYQIPADPEENQFKEPFIPLVNKETIPPVNKETIPPVNKPIIPPVNKETIPPVNKETIPPVNKETIPPVNKQTIPPVNKETIPPVNKEKEPLEDTKSMEARDASVENIFRKGLNDVPKAPFKDIKKLPDEPEKPIQ